MAAEEVSSINSARLGWVGKGERGAFNPVPEDRQKRREVWLSSVAWAAERLRNQVGPHIVVIFPLSHMLYSWDLTSLFSLSAPVSKSSGWGSPDSPLPKVRAPHTWGVWGRWAPGELGDSKIKTKPDPPSPHPFS